MLYPDVVVLAVALARTLKKDDEVWASFDMDKAFRFLAYHEMVRALGPQKSQAGPVFHSSTQCETVPGFAGHGKRTAWTVWKASPALTQALIDLTTAPHHVGEDAMLTIERLAILLHNRTST